MKPCPRAHLTNWPLSCPVCKSQGLETVHQTRRKAQEKARKARRNPKGVAATLLGKAHARARRKAA